MASLKHDLDWLYDNCRAALAGASDDMIKHELFNTLHEFFDETNCWTEQITLPVTANDNSYSLVPNEPGDILRIVWVIPTTDQHAFSESTFGTGFTIESKMDVPGTIEFRYAPTENATYYVKVAKTVALPVTRDRDPEMPDWVLAKYSRGIAAGVMGTMQAHIGRPYSNQQMAVYHLKRFRNYIARAKQDVTQSNMHGSQRWGFPQGWMRRKQR